MKKFILPIIVIALIALAILSPWSQALDFILNKLHLSSSTPASISVTSKVGQMKVFLNNEEVGTTPFEKDDLKSGSYNVRLEKVTESPEFYTKFERAIEVESGTQIVINWELGPSDEFSSGEIFFFKKQLEENSGSTVSVIVNPEDSKVYFDNAIQEGSPIMVQNVTAGEHTIKVEKDGYIAEDFSIVSKIGYDLFVEARIFPTPVDVIKE